MVLVCRRGSHTSRLQAFSTWDEKRAVENKMIAWFIWLVVTRGVAVDTAKGYLSTVSVWHERKWGPMMPLHSPAKLKAVMKGMARAFLAPPRRPRRGVKTQHLAAGLKKAFGPTTPAAARRRRRTPHTHTTRHAVVPRPPHSAYSLALSPRRQHLPPPPHPTLPHHPTRCRPETPS